MKRLGRVSSEGFKSGDLVRVQNTRSGEWDMKGKVEQVICHDRGTKTYTVLGEQSASVLDSHYDQDNAGGVHIFELYFNTLWGATGVVVLILLILLMCWLIHWGILHRCCYVVAVAFCGGGRPGTQGGGHGEEGGLRQSVPAVISYPSSRKHPYKCPCDK